MRLGRLEEGVGVGADARAGLEASDVDALSSFTMENLGEHQLAKDLGLGDLTFFSQIPFGGGEYTCVTISPGRRSARIAGSRM